MTRSTSAFIMATLPIFDDRSAFAGPMEKKKPKGGTRPPKINVAAAASKKGRFGFVHILTRAESQNDKQACGRRLDAAGSRASQVRREHPQAMGDSQPSPRRP